MTDMPAIAPSPSCQTTWEKYPVTRLAPTILELKLKRNDLLFYTFTHVDKYLN